MKSAVSVFMGVQKLVGAKLKFGDSRKICDRSVRPLLALSAVEGFTLNKVEGCRTSFAGQVPCAPDK
jgi:hypothetical protein